MPQALNEVDEILAVLASTETPGEDARPPSRQNSMYDFAHERPCRRSARRSKKTASYKPTKTWKEMLAVTRCAGFAGNSRALMHPSPVPASLRATATTAPLTVSAARPGCRLPALRPLTPRVAGRSLDGQLSIGSLDLGAPAMERAISGGTQSALVPPAAAVPAPASPSAGEAVSLEMIQIPMGDHQAGRMPSPKAVKFSESLESESAAKRELACRWHVRPTHRVRAAAHRPLSNMVEVSVSPVRAPLCRCPAESYRPARRSIGPVRARWSPPCSTTSSARCSSS